MTIGMRADPLPRLIANLNFGDVAQESTHKSSQLLDAVDIIL